MSTELTPAGPIEVFISYARQDEALREQLVEHLAGLEDQELISLWYDGKIVAGERWPSKIEEHLNTASIILLLISANFLASKPCKSESKRAMERDEKGEARVIPVILRPCHWKSTTIANFEVLPDGGKPVVEWSSRDAGFLNVAEGLEKAAKKSPDDPYIKSGNDLTTIVLISRGSPDHFSVEDFKRYLREHLGVNLEKITISVQGGSVKVIIEGDAEELSRIVKALHDPAFLRMFARRTDLKSISYFEGRREHTIAVGTFPGLAVRYVLGVAGIAALVAIIAGFSIDYRVAAFGTIMMLGLMLGLVTFSSLARDSSAGIRPFAVAVTWTFILLTAATSFCIISGFFFSWPRPLYAYLPTPSPTPSPIFSPTPSPSPTPVPIQITAIEIPPRGSGPDSLHRIAGKVTGVRPDNYRVVIYSLTNMWYVQPTTFEPTTEINPDGTWSADIHSGTRYAVLVVPKNFDPPNTTQSSPARIAGVVASTEVDATR